MRDSSLMSVFCPSNVFRLFSHQPTSTSRHLMKVWYQLFISELQPLENSVWVPDFTPLSFQNIWMPSRWTWTLLSMRTLFLRSKQVNCCCVLLLLWPLFYHTVKIPVLLCSYAREPRFTLKSSIFSLHYDSVVIVRGHKVTVLILTSSECENYLNTISLMEELQPEPEQEPEPEPEPEPQPVATVEAPPLRRSKRKKVLPSFLKGALLVTSSASDLRLRPRWHDSVTLQ